MKPISLRLYSPKNLATARYAQIGVTIAAAAACGYMAFASLMGVREVWSAQRQLEHQRAESRDLAREVRKLGSQRKTRPIPPCGGLDGFAVRFSAWSRDRRITIESMTPEGAPSPTEIKIGDARLGVWNASKVRVRGEGRFPMLMDLLDEFRNPELPVQLESFAFQSSCGERGGSVAFDLLLTVFEKKDGPT